MYLMDSQGQFAEFYAGINRKLNEKNFFSSSFLTVVVDKDPEYIIHSMEKHLAARGKIQPSLWWRIKEFFTID